MNLQLLIYLHFCLQFNSILLNSVHKVRRYNNEDPVKKMIKVSRPWNTLTEMQKEKSKYNINIVFQRFFYAWLIQMYIFIYYTEIIIQNASNFMLSHSVACFNFWLVDSQCYHNNMYSLCRFAQYGKILYTSHRTMRGFPVLADLK